MKDVLPSRSVLLRLTLNPTCRPRKVHKSICHEYDIHTSNTESKQYMDDRLLDKYTLGGLFSLSLVARYQITRCYHENAIGLHS